GIASTLCAGHSLSTSRCRCAWPLAPLPLVLLFLEAPVLRRPQAFEVLDHRRDLLIAQPALKGRHRQLRRLVERIAHPVADDGGELRVAVPPGMAAVVVGRGWEVAPCVRLLPVRRAFGVLAMAACAVLEVDLPPAGDLAGIQR